MKLLLLWSVSLPCPASDSTNLEERLGFGVINPIGKAGERVTHTLAQFGNNGSAFGGALHIRYYYLFVDLLPFAFVRAVIVGTDGTTATATTDGANTFPEWSGVSRTKTN